LTLEIDRGRIAIVAKLVRETVENEQMSFKDVVNDALRRGLRPAFRVVPHLSALQPGLDLRGFNQLADELEDESVMSKSPRKTL
jgi:hypothetical protein